MEPPFACEYLTGNADIAFPFREDAEGLVYENAVNGSQATVPRNFLLDLVATIPSNYLGQVYLKSIENIDGIYSLLFGTQTSDLITAELDTIPAARSVLAFRSVRVTLRLVTGPGFSAYLQGLGPGLVNSFQLRMPLESAALEFVPHKVLDLLVAGHSLDGDLALYEGHNISIDALPAEPLLGTRAQIMLTAGSGLGTGKHDPCGETLALDYVGRINGQTADSSGDLQLKSDSCYRVLPDAGSNMVQIINDCTPCCTCDDYAGYVETLRVLYQQMLLIKADITTGVSLINSDVTNWNDILVPLLFKPTVDIYVTRGHSAGVFTNADRKTASGRSPNFASVVVVVKNPRDIALTNVVLQISGLSGFTVLQSVYFDTAGQHTSGVATTFNIGTMPANSFFKPIVLIKAAYPYIVQGTFTATLTLNGHAPITESITT